MAENWVGYLLSVVASAGSQGLAFAAMETTNANVFFRGIWQSKGPLTVHHMLSGPLCAFFIVIFLHVLGRGTFFTNILGKACTQLVSLPGVLDCSQTGVFFFVRIFRHSRRSLKCRNDAYAVLVFHARSLHGRQLSIAWLPSRCPARKCSPCGDPRVPVAARSASLTKRCKFSIQPYLSGRMKRTGGDTRVMGKALSEVRVLESRR